MNLETSTLILNKDGSPLSIVPLSVVDWQTAIKLLTLEKVKVLKDHENWIVRSPSIELAVPSIVICTEYIKWQRRIKYSRTNVYLRDDFMCQLCGARPPVDLLTLDHVVPRSMGGKTNWANVITACRKCNGEKGNNHKVVPNKMPYKPTYYELLAKRKKHPIQIRDPDWAYYLGDWDPKMIRLVPVKKIN